MERVDGIYAGNDDDGDTEIDEALPAGALNFDCDGDGFTGVSENNVYSPSSSGDQDPCGTASEAFPFNVPIGWPADFETGGIPDSTDRVNVLDLTSFLAPVRRMNTNIGSSPGDRRWDLTPGAGILSYEINVQDLTALLVIHPPMLGGVRAFNGPACPEP